MKRSGNGGAVAEEPGMAKDDHDSNRDPEGREAGCGSQLARLARANLKRLLRGKCDIKFAWWLKSVLGLKFNNLKNSFFAQDLNSFERLYVHKLILKRTSNPI